MGYLKDTIKGVSWMGTLRVSTRVIAFVKIAILARLLTPVQFGLFGIASLVLAFLEISTETGVSVFLIQGEGKIKDYLNTAWVVSIIRGIFISSILVITAPVIASFFKSPDSKSLIIFMALVPFIRGFINPAIVSLQKNLQFDREFWLRSFIFFVDSLVAITIAIYTKNAVSIIWGFVVGAILEVILSYLLFKPHPKFAIEGVKIKRIVKRGKWITFAGIFKYFFEEGDDIVVGRLLPTASLGLYQTAYKISTLPITEIASVFIKVTFPVYAKIANDKDRLKNAFYRTTFFVTFLSLPVGILIFLFPEEIILIILGKNWLAASEALRVLSVFGVVKAVSDSTYALFMAVKKQEYITVLTLISVFGLAATVVPLVIKFGIVGAAISALVGLFFSIPLLVYYLRKVFSEGK